MNETEIYEMMTDHLKNLNDISKKCGEENLAGITSAMAETASFLIKHFPCWGVRSEKHFINET